LDLGRDFPLIVSSEAHSPNEIGRAFTGFLIEKIALVEIKRLFREEYGRKVML